MANSPAKLSYEEAYKKIKNPKQSKAEFIKAAKAYNTKKYGTTNPTKDAKDQGLDKAALADKFKKSQVEKKNTEAVSGTMRSKVDNKETATTTTTPPKDTRTPEQIVNDKKLKIAKDAIAGGDRKAGEKAGFEGREKRVANREGRKKDREFRKDDKEANKYEAKAGKEKSDKKKAIEAAGSRKAARLMDKSDAAKKAEKQEVDKYNKSYDPTSRGKARKKTAKDYKQVAKAEAKSDKVGSRLEKEQKKVVEKSKKEDAEKAPTTFKDFNQMDTVNAVKTAGEKSMSTMYSDGPIKYFKQSIKYDNSTRATAIKVAADEKDMTHASPKGKKELKHDVSSMISHATMNKPIAYMHGKIKKGGSILSKHMKS